MYEQFFKLSAEPFRLSPDHGFVYPHKGYTKAHAYMSYAFMRAEGFVMVTGRPGTGKTTLIGALVDELATQNVHIAKLVCSQLQADDLLKLVAYEFGVSTRVVEKGELLQALNHQLKSWHRDGSRALLIVDEAQDLSQSAMEELRLLTNIQVDSQPLLQIFLLGQPELRELILRPALEQVHQRIIAACHLKPLESDETEAYIRHRLNMVQWRGDPQISTAVYPLIYKFSEGVPRRINLICSRLLLHCAVEQRHQLRVKDVREVVRELQDENLAAGNSFTESDFMAEDHFEAPPVVKPPPAPAAPAQPDKARSAAQPASATAGSMPASTSATTQPERLKPSVVPAADPAAPAMCCPEAHTGFSSGSSLLKEAAPVARPETAPARGAASVPRPLQNSSQPPIPPMRRPSRGERNEVNWKHRGLVASAIVFITVIVVTLPMVGIDISFFKQLMLLD